MNSDGIIDTADLGALISQFGQTFGPFCVYTVDAMQITDPSGTMLSSATTDAGPQPGETVAIFNDFFYSNDNDTDGCPDCAFFSILPVGVSDSVYGRWTLLDAAQTDLVGVDFFGGVIEDTCSGYGANAVLANARGETNIQTASILVGAKTHFPRFEPTPGQELIIEIDCYLTSLYTFHWIDVVSETEDLVAARVMMGGYAQSINADFLKYSTDGTGFINHFVFLGALPANFEFGQFYGTAPDPLLPGGVAANPGIEIKTNDWFTLSFRLKTDEFSIWLKDSETMALPDVPGDDGSSTPLDGSDDFEAGFAKIFPFGPFGIAPGRDDGQPPVIPQPPLAALSVDALRFVWGGDPTQAEVPGYAPTNAYFDNIHVDGPLAPPPTLATFRGLPFTDNIDSYPPAPR